MTTTKPYAWKPASAPREIYANTADTDDLIGAIYQLEDQLLQVATAYGDKASETLARVAASIRARHNTLFSNADEDRKAFGEVFRDYVVVPAPDDVLPVAAIAAVRVVRELAPRRYSIDPAERQARPLTWRQRLALWLL